jgi:hypothetical protein
LIINLTLIIWNVKYKNEINLLKEEQKNNHDQIKANFDLLKDLQNDHNNMLKKVFYYI